MKSAYSFRLHRLFCLLAVVSLVSAPPARAVDEEWVLTAGSLGGSWFPLAATMIELFNRAKIGIHFSQKPGNVIANLHEVGTGRVQLGLSVSNLTVLGLKGRGQFDGKPLGKLRNIATLDIYYFTLLATKGSSIERIEHLRGKRYIPMVRGNSGEQLAEIILKAHGLTYSDVGKVHFVGPEDGVALIKDGHADAISSLTVVPLPVYTDLANSRDMRLAGIAPEKVRAATEAGPGLIPLTIPASVYRGQPNPVDTVGAVGHLFTNADAPADKIYAITRILVENLSELSQVHSSYRGLTLNGLAKNIPVPFHPGAVRYYHERGAQ